MIAQLRRFIEMHGESRFTDWDRGANEHAPRTFNRAGFRRTKSEGEQGNNTTEYFVLPEVFKSEVCLGHEPRAMTKVLIAAGFIERGADEGSQSRDICGRGKDGSDDRQNFIMLGCRDGKVRLALCLAVKAQTRSGRL